MIKLTPKTIHDKGLHDIPTKTSELTNDSGFLTSDDDSAYQLISNRGVTYPELDANFRLPENRIPTKILSSYWHASWDERTVVQGTWVQNTGYASQTDYDSSLISSAGVIVNSGTHNDLDELHFGSISLNAGTYKVSFSYIQTNDSGILEVLIGNTSIGTKDLYGIPTTSNVTGFFTYSPTTRVSGNLRIRINGKNGSSLNHQVYLGRIEIIRTS